MGTKEITIPHNENRIPTILGYYVIGSSIETSYRFDSVRLLSVTNTVFNLVYYKAQQYGSFTFYVVYY